MTIRTTGIQQPTPAALITTVQGLVEAVNMLQGVNAKADRAVRLSELQNVGLLRDTGMQISVGDRLTDLDASLLGITGQLEAVASAVDTLSAEVLTGPSGVTSQARKLTELSASIALTGKNLNGVERAVVAAANASQELLTRVTVSEDAINIEARRIDSLMSALSGFTAKIGDLETELIVVATATQTLDTRVTATEAGVSANAGFITDLFASITSIDGALLTQGTAISDLDTRVTVTEAGLTSVSSDVVTLTSTVATKNRTFAQAAQPDGVTQGPFSISDMWIDTDDGNRVWVWSGTAWVDASDTRFGARNRVLAQPAQPTGTFVINDLWIDTDDGNRVYRWTGTAWVDVSDTRVSTNASAVSSLTTSVTNINGTLSSQATQLTTLTSTVGDNTASITQQATVIDGLEARAFLKLDVNGKIAGYEINNNGITNDFTVLADSFRVVSSSGLPILSAASVSDGQNALIGGVVENVASLKINRFLPDLSNGFISNIELGHNNGSPIFVVETTNFNVPKWVDFKVLGTTYLQFHSVSGIDFPSAANQPTVLGNKIWHAGNFASSPLTDNVPTWNGSSWVATTPPWATSSNATLTGTTTATGAVNMQSTVQRGNANSPTTLTAQPRIFVQSTDPGAAAADGDLWLW